MISYAELQEIEELEICPGCQYKAGLLLEAVSDWPVYGLMEPVELLNCLHAEIGETLTAETITVFYDVLLQSTMEDAIWKAQSCAELIEFLRAKDEQPSSQTLEHAIAALEKECIRVEKAS
jgi:hypothetical protein